VNDNPYASPQAVDPPKSPEPLEHLPQTDFYRGAIMALIWGAFGSLVIPGVKYGFAGTQLLFGGSILDFRQEIAMWRVVVPGAAILGFVFAGAAMASYAPAKGHGFVRNLGLSAGITIGWGFVVSWLAPLLGFERTRGSILAPEYLTFLALIVSLAPIVVCVCVIWKSIHHCRQTIETGAR
jgi:hypothetical protein